MINNSELKKVFLIAIVFTIVLGYLDFSTMNFWNTDLTKDFGIFYWDFVLVAVVLAASMVWIFKRDKSEAIAVGSVLYIMSITGWEDFWFYIISQQSIPASMIHLYNNGTFMGGVAKFMGLSTVTPTSLIVSMILGLVGSYYLAKYLIKKF